MKLAYCTTVCRRLEHYLPELLEMDDLFTITFYCCYGNAEMIVSEPDARGKIMGSHIVYCIETISMILSMVRLFIILNTHFAASS